MVKPLSFSHCRYVEEPGCFQYIQVTLRILMNEVSEKGQCISLFFLSSYEFSLLFPPIACILSRSGLLANSKDRSAYRSAIHYRRIIWEVRLFLRAKGAPSRIQNLHRAILSHEQYTSPFNCTMLRYYGERTVRRIVCKKARMDTGRETIFLFTCINQRFIQRA